MLNDNDAVSTIAVRDVTVARKFYEDTLGLKREESEQSEVLSFQSGKSTIFVYQSEFAGTNKATAVTWVVDDIQVIAQDLKAKGVVFEHYDFPGMKLDGDVHVMGNIKAAWFKDPDGNILAIVNS